MKNVILFHGKGKALETASFPDPVPNGAELLVEVTCCALCRSDLHTWLGNRHSPLPVVLGHEIVGRIAAFGADASRIDARGVTCSVGDRISWTVASPCGTCFFCHKGLTQKCLSLRKYGHEQCTDDDPFHGGLADQIVLWPGTPWVRLPGSIPDRVAALANCSVATAAAVLRSAGGVAGSTVVILGAGILGLMACALAREAGAAQVIMSDPLESHRQRALAFGATVALDSDPAVLQSQVLAATENRGADFVLELAGTASAVQTGISLLRIGGTMILAGTVAPVEMIPLDAERLVRRMLTLRGLHNYQLGDLLKAIDFLDTCAGKYPFASLVGKSFAISEAEQAFAYSQAHPGQRAVVVMNQKE